MELSAFQASLRRGTLSVLMFNPAITDGDWGLVRVGTGQGKRGLQRMRSAAPASLCPCGGDFAAAAAAS
eukprot:scaffold7384_cov396-Prasinococcus_capsulatus_cf.AAC.3